MVMRRARKERNSMMEERITNKYLRCQWWDGHVCFVLFCFFDNMLILSCGNFWRTIFEVEGTIQIKEEQCGWVRERENLKLLRVEASNARQTPVQNSNFILKSISGCWRVWRMVVTSYDSSVFEFCCWVDNRAIEFIIETIQGFTLFSPHFCPESIFLFSILFVLPCAPFNFASFL